MGDFLGIPGAVSFPHKYVPVLAVDGDMWWDSCEIRQKASMVSLWNRLLGLPTNRVPGEIFYWKLSVEGELVIECEINVHYPELKKFGKSPN